MKPNQFGTTRADLIPGYGARVIECSGSHVRIPFRQTRSSKRSGNSCTLTALKVVNVVIDSLSGRTQTGFGYRHDPDGSTRRPTHLPFQNRAVFQNRERAVLVG